MSAEKSVVKVFCNISAKPVYSRPGTTESSFTQTGSGYIVDLFQILSLSPKPMWSSDAVVMEPGMLKEKLAKMSGLTENSKGQFLVLVTNAHVVYGSTSTTFFIDGYDGRLDCSLLTLCHQFDLAFLVPSKPLENVTPLQMALDLPKRGEKVISLGYPSGVSNDVLAAGHGAISRTGCAVYTHSQSSLLNIETTASINSGNSGGPLVSEEGHVRGTVHQRSMSGNQQAFAVPNIYLYAFIRGFLERQRQETACPGVPIRYNALINRTQRERLGLDEDMVGGVFVTKVSPLFDKMEDKARIKAGDVLLKVDGFPVSSKGEVKVDGVSIMWGTLIDIRTLHESIDVTVLRDGQIYDIKVTLNIPESELLTVPALPSLRGPGYYFESGVIFAQVHFRYTIECSKGGKNITPIKIHDATRSRDYRPPLGDKEGKREVVFAKLTGDAVVGYEGLGRELIITHLNETLIESLSHLHRIFRSIKPNVIFSLRTSDSAVDNVTLKAVDAPTNERLFKEVGLPKQHNLTGGQRACMLWSEVRTAFEEGKLKQSLEDASGVSPHP